MDIKHMPMTEGVMDSLFDKCKEEWLQTREGQKYGQMYTQLAEELRSIESKMDKHIANYIEEKMEH